MPSLLAYWTLRFCAGLAVLVASGLGLPSAQLRDWLGAGSFAALDVLLGALGFYAAMGAVTPLVRVLGADARLRRDWGAAAHSRFARATTAQRVYSLLLAVAEADGRAGATERQLVRAFLQSRFDERQRRDLDAWAADQAPLRDLTELARLLARELAKGERATVYSWSCLVAFADGDVKAAEFRALQQIATGFGIDPHHASFLFEFAQQAVKRQRFAREDGGPPGSGDDRDRSRRTAPPPRPTAPRSARDRALDTLGLPADATQEQIRLRHRELARRFHPDLHRKLGPIAQREATERFVAIQRAYEVLTSG